MQPGLDVETSDSRELLGAIEHHSSSKRDGL